MIRLDVYDLRCEALFVSDLQPSDAPHGAAMAAAAGAAVRQHGVSGCADRMAEEFGDHPETAVARMRWIRQIVAEVPVEWPLLVWLDRHHHGSPDDTGPMPRAA
jgi:hypothetical protein